VRTGGGIFAVSWWDDDVGPVRGCAAQGKTLRTELGLSS
jgi:hypothetical protein